MDRNDAFHAINLGPRNAGALFVGTLTTVALSWGFVAAAPAAAYGACSRTAWDAFVACHFEVEDDFWEARGICRNESNPDERADCFDEARQKRKEARELCWEQWAARRNLCDALGEGRYDPPFEPQDFETDLDDLAHPNPYFPLAVGNLWVYEEEEATVTVEVLDKTKQIEGVTCFVVHDLEEEDGEVSEDTDDWFAHAIAGDVHYCGEISGEFEFFDGDDPEEAELVSIDGSWKAGRDGAKSGVLVPLAPQVGDVYRQEWALGDAEDVAEVLSVDYGFGDDPELDENVPKQLATLLCNDDCRVTREFTPLEPEAEERKYYAPGIGLFLEVDVESGDAVQLVECNVDPLCDALPQP